MNDRVYEQHDAAFRGISAAALILNGEKVGTVSFKVGAGVQCFLHIHGCEMVKGIARGGGYDRKTAAFESAAAKLPDQHPAWPRAQDWGKALSLVKHLALPSAQRSWSWDRALNEAGIDVAVAI